MQKIRQLVGAIGAYNLTLIGFALSFVVAVVGMQAELNAVFLGLATVCATGCFISLLFQQRGTAAVDRSNIDEQWSAMVQSIKAAHMLAMKEMATCSDPKVVEAVADQLMSAASHMGSNPAWRNVHRITTAADIVSWYETGKGKADEAKAMIERYVAGR
ncbi:MAG: hypothetical protein WCT03_25840 [Candidatus Obscuribacterales bacterium]|jgi:uncharacterized membrane protein YuzA (DUF378 family)